MTLSLCFSVDCSYVLYAACFYPRLVCVAVLGLIALCIGRLVHALAALSVPVDVTHSISVWGAGAVFYDPNGIVQSNSQK